MRKTYIATEEQVDYVLNSLRDTKLKQYVTFSFFVDTFCMPQNVYHISNSSLLSRDSQYFVKCRHWFYEVSRDWFYLAHEVYLKRNGGEVFPDTRENLFVRYKQFVEPLGIDTKKVTLTSLQLGRIRSDYHNGLNSKNLLQKKYKRWSSKYLWKQIMYALENDKSHVDHLPGTKEVFKDDQIYTRYLKRRIRERTFAKNKKRNHYLRLLEKGDIVDSTVKTVVPVHDYLLDDF